MIRRAVSRTAFLACLLLPPLLACGARIAADEPETIQETLKDVWNVGTIGEDARQEIETWPDREVAIEALSAAITSDSISDPSCRYWLLNALLDKSQGDANRRVRFEHPAQILALEHAMHDSSRQMRVLAAQKLTQVGESFRTRAQSALLNGLEDSELIVVSASAGSLWEIAERDVQGPRPRSACSGHELTNTRLGATPLRQVRNSRRRTRRCTEASARSPNCSWGTTSSTRSKWLSRQPRIPARY